MPRPRSLPPDLGISFSRTGKGSNRRTLRSSRSPVRNVSLPKTMERGATPSTPTDRAPRLPRTRAHATVRNAGSATRLKRSSNRRSGSSVAHWCSLVWIRRTRASASSRSGHGAPVFTGVLRIFQSHRCELTAFLRHAAGFPDLGLLRRLRPVPELSADDEPARRRPDWPEGRAARGPFPRSPMTVRQVRRPAFPRQHRHEYAAGLPHGLLADPVDQLRSRPSEPRPGVHCDPAHIHQVGAGSGLAGVRPLVPALVHLPVSLAGPGAVWQYRPVPSLSGLLPPSPASPGSGCPQLQQAAATAHRGSPLTSPRSHGASWRTTGRQ